jgi:hypothetical protein
MFLYFNESICINLTVAVWCLRAETMAWKDPRGFSPTDTGQIELADIQTSVCYQCHLLLLTAVVHYVA